MYLVSGTFYFEKADLKGLRWTDDGKGIELAEGDKTIMFPSEEDARNFLEKLEDDLADRNMRGIAYV